jgi:hypothetical protein
MKRPLVGMVAILTLAIGTLTSPVTYAQSCCTCTCYAHERRPDLATIATGDAKDWIVEAEAAGRPTGTEPRVSAIVVFQPGVQGADLTRGHVAYVESEYSPTSFRISEKGWYDPPRWNDRCAVHYRDASTGDGVAFIYISTYDTPFLDDTELEDKSAMSLQCIRRFLNEQGSYFKGEVSDVDGQPLDLAREVYDAAQTYGINPKVILATLEKESTAITRQTRPSDNGMRNLTGCSWGSTAREQVACTAERFWAYHDAQKSGGTTPNGWRVGVSKETQDHVTVTPATMAVAGQFAYTPYAGFQWGGDDPRWGGVFLFYDAWYNKFHFDTYICPSSVDVALIIDGTGSMNTNDPNDLRKEAAKVFIDASQFGDRIAVVAFNTSAYHYAPLRTIQSGADKDMLKAAADQVSSSGCTNLNVGLQGGFDELFTGIADSNGKAAVFLTDGRQECSGPYDPHSHLQYKDRGWPIYTVGLGDGADQNLLRQIAADTGGQYIALTDPNQLQAVYFEILQLIAGGNIVLNTSVPVTQGSSQQMTVSLPSSQSAAIFFTGWQGSEVSMSLTTPSDRQIGPLITDPDVYHAKGLTYEIYIVQHPEAGQWILDLFGTSLPSGGELVDIRVAVHGPRFVYLPVICKNYTPGLGPTNHPPNTPSNPSPADGATDQSIDVNLNWTGGDPNPGDSVTYDVYFEVGDSTPDELVCLDVTNTFCDPGMLSHGMHYYWQVVATDSHGATRTGPTWDFTTAATPGWRAVGTGSASGGGISDNSGDSRIPLIVIAPDDTPYIAWQDDSSGDDEIYVRRWNGSNWEEVGTSSASGGGISGNSGQSRVPSMAIAPDGTLYITWQDDSSGDEEIYVRRWNGSYWEEVGAGSASGGGISDSSGRSHYPSVAIAPDGTPYVAWDDNSDGDWEIYVRRWNGSYWEEVGTGSASGGGISGNNGTSGEPSVAIAPGSTPYVAWYDRSEGDEEIYVRRWVE